MFSIKKLVNRKHDLTEAESFKQVVYDIYMTASNKFKHLMSISDVSNFNTVERFTSLVEGLVASVDLYAENKFSSPSTLISLRSALSKVTEGMSIFVPTIIENTSNVESNPHDLMMRMAKAMDLMCTGMRMIEHNIIFDFKMVTMGVDIIERYYKQQENPTKGIMFNVAFTQPTKISNNKGEKKDGSNRRH